MMATAGLFAANSRASRSIVAAGTPVFSATFAGANSAASALVLSTSAAIASASKPSVPGLQATNSSALAAVCERRASTCTNLARVPGRAWRIRPYAALCATAEFHVPRKSAPNEIT